MQPYNLEQLIRPFQDFAKNVALFLPRSSDLRQLAAHQDGTKKLEVVHYCMEGASKALCAYFGDFTFQNSGA